MSPYGGSIDRFDADTMTWLSSIGGPRYVGRIQAASVGCEVYVTSNPSNELQIIEATIPTITNCTFSLNTVVENDHTDGGGLYSYRSHTPGSGAPTVVNSIFWDNEDTTAGTNSEAANILETIDATTSESERYTTSYS